MDQETLDTIRREVASRFLWQYAMLYTSVACVIGAAAYLLYDIWRSWHSRDP